MNQSSWRWFSLLSLFQIGLKNCCVIPSCGFTDENNKYSTDDTEAAAILQFLVIIRSTSTEQCQYAGNYSGSHHSLIRQNTRQCIWTWNTCFLYLKFSFVKQSTLCWLINDRKWYCRKQVKNSFCSCLLALFIFLAYTDIHWI